jgi:hypothetical protein
MILRGDPALFAHFVDLIDLESNLLTTMPVGEVLDPAYPPLRYLVR